MSALDVTTDHTYGNRNGCWRKRYAAPVISSTVSRAEDLLRERIRCRNADISVQFDPSRGTLTLRGEVGSYYQKQLAQEAVRHLEQVSHVVNRLDVRELIPQPDVAGGRRTTATPETDGESS
mgnify:CR=1 FL=1